MKISAYISLLDDWDLLSISLSSIMPLVDELVVADGAYEYIAPFFERMGRDPRCSSPSTLKILSQYSNKIKIINGVWSNEFDKRKSAYEACTGDYIIRADADEYAFFNEEKLRKFFDSGSAVGKTDIPLYICPGRVRKHTTYDGPEDLGVIFKRREIDSEEHLSYLWLVAPKDSKIRLNQRVESKVHQDILAFHAHLTNWRPPSTSLNRVLFYVLNYIQDGGHCAWISKYRIEQLENLSQYFRDVDLKNVMDVLMGHGITVGFPALEGGWGLGSSPLSASQENFFLGAYGNFINGLRQSNRALMSEGRACVSGEPIYLDLTADSEASLHSNDSVLILETRLPLSAAKCIISYLIDCDPWIIKIEAGVVINDCLAEITIPDCNNKYLRRVVNIQMWAIDGIIWNEFKVISHTTLSAERRDLM